MPKSSRILGLPAACAAAIAVMPYAHGATITVDSTADNAVDDGACTLREAMSSAQFNSSSNGDCVAGQAAPVVDLIAFAIPGNGPHVIEATQSVIGNFTESLTIDGSTQPGSVPNSATPQQGGLNGTVAIGISGAGCPGCIPFAFGLSSGEATLRGLAISHFGTVLSQSGAVPVTYRIEGCHIGTDTDGLASTGTQQAFVVAGGTWLIGGTTPAQRNLIVAESGAMFTQSAANVTVQGNLIGTTRNGLAPLPMSGDAIHLRLFAGGSAQIGGADSNSRNVIASASGYGVHLIGFGADGTAMRVVGNHIGVGADGVTPLPNVTAGIRFGANDPPVNGWPLVEGNVIAWNAGPGVIVAGANAVTEIVGNSMHDNGFGIDLDENGPTRNDVDDSDTGANALMNFPEFGYSWNSGQYAIRYRVDTTVANAAYPLRVDFYLAASVDDAEGVQWLGSDTIDAGDAQQWRAINVPGPQGYALAATTTDALGRTSEFTTPDRIFADSFEVL